MSVVGRLERVVVDVEGVRVLHHELTATQETGARSGFVAVLGLYLKDRQGQLLVRRADVLHQQREHLLVRRTQQVVGAPPVLQAEQVVAVLAPTAGRLVRLSRQQSRDVNLLEAGPFHLLPHDPLDIPQHHPAERQPGEDARCRTADIASSNEELVASDVRIGRVVAQCPQEESRHPKRHM
jgi:hypothetical protein